MKPRSIRCMKFFLTLLNIICILFGLLLMALCVVTMRDRKSRPQEQSTLSHGVLSFLLTLGLALVVTAVLGCVGALREHVKILYVLFGLLLMALCVVTMRDRKSRPQEQSTLSHGVLSFLLTLGLALVVTAVLGCVGALREHVKILYVHACFFIFLVSVELVVGVGGAVLSAWVGGGSNLRVQFYRNFTVDDETTNNSMALWDSVQSENKCCGVDGPEDYAALDRPVPPSCCERAHPLREGNARRHFHEACLADRTYYMRGCEEIIRRKKSITGSVCIAIGVIFTLLEITCIILALWMTRTLRSERRKLQEELQAHFET